MPLKPGETTEVKGSAVKPYTIKNVDGVVWSCTCPGWKNCGGAVDQKTCKHLRQLRGEAAEAARIGKVVAAPTGEKKLRPDEKAKLNGPPVLLAHKLSEVPALDPTGWWYSEKLDGVRAYWNGKDFISRQGNVFHAPAWFKEGLPDYPMDGELWMERRSFEKTISVVKRFDAGEQWRKIWFCAFDLPNHPGLFEERMAALDAYAQQHKPPFLKIHSQSLVLSMSHLLAELDRFILLGAEGLMIRKPKSLYEAGKSYTLLKVKRFYDAEAVVIEHIPGKGKHKGRMGAIVVRMPNGIEFELGTGFSDDVRKNPPAIGVSVTYKYPELTAAGVPKHASFIAVRDYE